MTETPGPIDSLVVELRHNGRMILLPGDLEGPALEQVLPRLPTADVLVSPHHGSRMANIPQVRQALQPQHVVVSARNDDARSRLQNVYETAELHFTSEAGAVTIVVNDTGQLSVHGYRSGQQRH